MKKIIQQLQTKPPEVRLVVAGILALGATGIIIAGWAVASPSTPSRASSKTPGPLQAITQTIKTGTQDISTIINSSNSDEQPQIEIINISNQPTTLFDESNPYQGENLQIITESLSDVTLQ